MNLVTLFVKYPQAGVVKTRLGEVLGHERAAVLYKNLAETVVRSAAPLKNSSYRLEVCFSPRDKESLFRQWLSGGWSFHPQEGNYLGERMQHAVQRSLQAGFSKIIIIGSDCPAVTENLLEQGFSHLDDHDVVTGPACDGGYYLIGMKKSCPLLFEGIDWGTEHVYDQTLDAVRTTKLSHASLPVLRDVDRIEDLAYYINLGMFTDYKTFVDRV